MYPGSAGVPGPRDPSLTPYIVAFERFFEDPRYEVCVLITGTQMSKTDGVLDVMGWRLDTKPRPQLYVGPNKDFVTELFEPRLMRLFDEAVSLKDLVARGKRNKKTRKTVNGVSVRLAWAGSATSLSSDQAGDVYVDEYDKMVTGVRGEGDPFTLAKARADTYADRKIAVTSTPKRGRVITEKGKGGLEFWKMAEPIDLESPIWAKWQTGTRHHWAWQCPHCEAWFIPRVRDLKCDAGATPAQARRRTWIVCPLSGCIIEETSKASMNAHGRFVAPGQSITPAGELEGDPPDASTLSLWVSGLASPFVNWGERLEEMMLAATGEAEMRQGAVNKAGELWAADGGDLPEWQVIKRLAEPYKPGSVPAEAIFLTFAGDVQKNRIVYVVRGWGARATSWLVENGELWGETSQVEVWDDLAQKLTTPIDGLLIKLAFLDSGFRPGKKFEVPVNRVYEFCRRFRSFVFPTKGASVALVTPLVKRKIEVTQQGTQAKYGLDLIRLDPNYWKSWVHERLDWPPDQPGAFHLHEEVSEDYCRQLVAEAMVRGPSGKPVWIERARENHYLDAEAMCAAAGFMLNAQHIRVGAQRRQDAPVPRPGGPPAPAGSAITPSERFSKFANDLNG